MSFFARHGNGGKTWNCLSSFLTKAGFFNLDPLPFSRLTTIGFFLSAAWIMTDSNC